MPLSAPGVSTFPPAPVWIPAANRPAPDPRTTQQQRDIIDATHEGGIVVAEALAGTGKTSTLVEIARSMPGRPMMYLAFNKSIQLEAASRFPTWVDCRTAHSVAFQAVGRPYADRLSGRRMSAQAMARKLKVKAEMLDSGTLNPTVITRMAQATVAEFMKTADPLIFTHHIPARVLANHNPNEITKIVLPVAEAIWADLSRPNGEFYFTHDVYLKLWQLTNPTLPASMIMFDEAQDADPVIASVVGKQNAQRIYVGDQNQAIYGWRGAVDAMSGIDGATYLPLTKSFRFGPAIAEQANEWLKLMGAKHRVVGHDPIESRIDSVPVPRAILCRTNGTALGWVLQFHDHGIKVALAPGDKNAGKDIERFAWAARDLMKGEGTDHPDLVGFPDWQALTKFVEEEENTADLKRMVGIINRIGVSGVIDAIRGLSLERDAQVTVSTAHKAKGLEWDSVKVADDFTPPDPDEDEQADPADLMLAYVTVTRAKRVLDPGSLAEPGLWA